MKILFKSNIQGLRRILLKLCASEDKQSPPSKVFFSTSAYFVNGNTQLMSDLTDKQFYSSAERIWLCIHFAKWACDRLTEDADFGKKKVIFSDDLGGYVNKQNCRIWDTENPHAYIEKPTHCLVLDPEA